MRFTLRQIQVFLAVAQDQSVSAAASALNMSQSAVSGALADLEKQFDIQLFDRIGKRLQLSALGTALRPASEALLDQARALQYDLEGRGSAGTLRVGATQTIGNHLAVPLVARCMAEQPALRISLEMANTEAIARKVRNFEIDVGLIEGQVHDPDLELSSWFEDELVVFCAPDHPLAHAGPLGDEALCSAVWIVREPGSGTRQAFEHGMRGLLPELSIALELQHNEAIRGAVAAGLGVGCVSRIAIADALRFGQVVACPVPGRDFRRQFYTVLHRRKFRAPAIEHLLALCRAEAAPT